MSHDAILTLIVTGIAFALFLSDRLPVDIVGIGVLLALAIAGVVTPEEALAGFSNSALVTIAAMFVLSAGLVRTGSLDRVTRGVMALAGDSKRAQIALLLLTVAFVSAFMNNTPVAIIFLPVFLGVAARHGTQPSRLLIPMSFATILGGTCTLIGTSTNLVSSQAAARAGLPEIGMFDFAVPGILYALAGFAFLAIAGPRLLPRRASVTSVSSGGKLREFVTEVVFPAGSPLVGKSYQDVLSRVPGITPIMVVRGDETHMAPLVGNPHTQFIRARDVLLLRGAPDAINDLLRREGVELPAELGAAMASRVRGRTVTMVELVLVPNSPLIGRTLRGVGFARKHVDTAVLAVLRRDEHLRERVSELRLRLGDTLLAVADEEQLEALRNDEDFLLLEDVEQQVVRRGQAPLAVAIMAAVVIVASTELLPMSLSALAGAGLMVLVGCLPARVAYNSVDLSILALIAGMLTLGLAWEKTGLIGEISDGVLHSLSPYGPRAVLAGLFLLATVLTNFCTNTAVAVLLVPAGIQIAAALQLAPEPFVYAAMFGASCDFATPVGYQTNLLVYGPGGYRFLDYTRIGIPLTIVLFAVSMVVIPWWFPLVPLAP